MAGFIKGVEVEKIETMALNTKISKEVFNNFKVRCLQLRLPMNVVLEIFMRQYTNKRYSLRDSDILKWKNYDGEVDTLNTTFNKEIYFDFKATCKNNGFFVKHVITSFMEQFSSREFVLEYVDVIDMVRIEDIEIIEDIET